MANARFSVILAVIVCLSIPAFAADANPSRPDADSGKTTSWLEMGELLAQKAEARKAEAAAAAAEPAKKGPPIPLLTIEGVAGGVITPMAYMVNTGPAGTIVGKPAIAYTFLNLGSKTIHAVSITQTFLRRIELGYAYNHFNIATLPTDIKKATGINAGRNDLHLNHFNLRAMLIEEDSFDLPLPAITVGVHFKHNEGIKKIDSRLGGALRGMGYERHYGMDYTLTATKMFPKLGFGRPVILTGGMRLSRGAQIGLLGFGDSTALTFEGSVAYLPTDWLLLAYEIRTKNNPFHVTNSLIGREQNWHAFSATWLVNEHLSVSGVYGFLGTVANANADPTFAIQVKYEF